MSTHALPARKDKSDSGSLGKILKWTALGGLFATGLYLVIALYAQGQTPFALLFLVLIGSACYIFANPNTYAHRYIYPSLAGMFVFIMFPLFYTVGIGFTNYSASNLLDFDRVNQVLESQVYQSGDARYGFRVFGDGDEVRIAIDTGDGELWATKPLDLEETEGEHRLQPWVKPPDSDEALTLREVIKLKKALGRQTLVYGDTHLSMAGLRDFASIEALYTRLDEQRIRNNETGKEYLANQETGFYEAANGERLTPGWTVAIGWGNYTRVITDPSIRGPFMQIFVWTVVFAGLTVLFTLALGLFLANLLQWDQIKGKAFYRMMLILPYAVPAFISILVFKGLFNQNFGEINLVLENLFGLRPDWFSDPTLARSMILIVNTWLGYPYMMLLCMGLLQAIPRDLYEASAMDGATPIDNLFRITLPQLIRPLMPLLIASFAFNFNNFVLIALLTGGAPDIIGATTPAGTTDLLVSYTYRIAFQDSGQNFGLAAAIATVIFLLVGTLSWLNLRLSKVQV